MLFNSAALFAFVTLTSGHIALPVDTNLNGALGTVEAVKDHGPTSTTTKNIGSLLTSVTGDIGNSVRFGKRRLPTIVERSGGADVQVTIGYLQTATQLSSDCNDIITRLNLFTVAIEGYKAAQCLSRIAAKIPTAVSALSSMTSVNDPDALSIVGVLKTFVSVHQALLSTVIGKHGLLSWFFFVEPVRLALVAIEGAVDRLAYGLINLIPTRQIEGNNAKASLDTSLQEAIQVYS